MPIQQSGNNVTVCIRDNDVGRNQSNYHHMLESGALDHVLENTSILEFTIWVIEEIAKSVLIDMAKVILADIAMMLRRLKWRFIGREHSLNPPARICKNICSTLALATIGRSMDHLPEIYLNAFRELRSAIDRLPQKVKSSPLQRLLDSSLHVKEIDEWTVELEIISTSFSESLNIIPVIPLEQIYEFRERLSEIHFIPSPLSLPPVMCFGREGLLHEIKSALLDDKNVTLIGPGGIGKSTLAIVLMNEKEIIKRYRRRFFVSYANINQKTITFSLFVECIARVLWVSTSAQQVKTNLGLSPVLLVLDSAETFEDAENRGEATKISSFIADIAQISGVRIIVTSRTRTSARGVVWTAFDVPPLEREPAWLFFKNIFQAEDISDDEIERLLAEIDFHPLSISILAHMATENQWSGKVLLTEWKSQRGKIILQAGDSSGKDSLRSTVMLSLESPSVKALGEAAKHVLWIIAFFPQGINRDHLPRLFPSASSDIQNAIDILYNASLVYPSPPFITMLTPVRLFLLDAFKDKGSELLSDARHVYYHSLREITRKKDEHSTLLSDHLNIERLILADIECPPSELDNEDFISTWNGFIFGLAWHNPFPTSLGPHISSLPESSTSEKRSKAWCLHALGSLDFELAIFSSAAKYDLDARALFVSIEAHSMVWYCTFNAAVAYNNNGHFIRAKQLLEDFIGSPSWKDINQECRDEYNYISDMLKVRTSSEGIDNLFVPPTDHANGLDGLTSHVLHWQARLWHGYDTPEHVQQNLERLRSEWLSSPDAWDHWKFLYAMAEVAYLQQDYVRAMQHLEEAHESVQGNFQLTLIVLTFQATVASDQGDYKRARTLLQHGLDAHSVVATSPSTDLLRILYARGRNELYAGQYGTAFKLLAEVVSDCDAQDDLYTKTLCMRALGEVARLMDRASDSVEYFEQTVMLCRESGAPPALLGVCTPMLKLDDGRFMGWNRYLEERTITGTA